jgi:hydrogenase expression/formation protein HypC
MCLAVPARIYDFPIEDELFAIADILGVRRKISLQLLEDDLPQVGDWVLIHVGFAMSRISDQHAQDQLRMLAELGEAAPDVDDGHEQLAE